MVFIIAVTDVTISVICLMIIRDSSLEFGKPSFSYLGLKIWIVLHFPQDFHSYCYVEVPSDISLHCLR